MTAIQFKATEDWSVGQLQELLHHLNVLYNRLYVLQFVAPTSGAKLDNLLLGSLSKVPREHALVVGSMEIHSPGDFSFLGVDKVIAQLRGLIRDVQYRNRLEKKRLEQQLETQAARDAEDLEHQRELNRLERREREEALLQERLLSLRLAGVPDDKIPAAVARLAPPLMQAIELMDDQEVELVEDSTDA